MKLVEQEMVLQAARDQVDAMEPPLQPPPTEQPTPTLGSLHIQYDALEETLNSDTASEAERTAARAKLAALASPRLMTVWFNAW